MTEPNKYDMSKPEDRARWYREMKGYLSLAGEDNFLVQGTDRAGRKYAFEAFCAIEREFSGDFQSEREKVLDCRQEVKDFAVLMEQKLRKNDHKISWKKCNQEYLLQRLDDEVKELHECFFIYSPADMNFLMDGQHEDRIPGEAADVANFAMMLWDNFGDKELRKQEAQR